MSSARFGVVRAEPPMSASSLVAVPAELSAVAQRQCGVLTRLQLAAFGFDVAKVRAAIAARRWQSFGRGVVVLHNAALSHSQRDWVAVLLPLKPTALAGLSAATASGLQGFEPDRVHIVVRHDTHTRVPAWVWLHESRRFAPTDIAAAAGAPRTTIARSLIDGATWSRSARRACAILCAGVQQRFVTAAELESELRRAGSVRHVAIMRGILGDIGGGGHTLAELDLGPLALRAGLPAPRRQVLRREPSGTVRYVDAEFVLPDGTVLAVEIDGAGHLLPATWWADQDRQNELVIAGSPVLRFPSVVMRLDDIRVVDQLRRFRIAHN